MRIDEGIDKTVRLDELITNGIVCDVRFAHWANQSWRNVAQTIPRDILPPDGGDQHSDGFWWEYHSGVVNVAPKEVDVQECTFCGKRHQNGFEEPCCADEFVKACEEGFGDEDHYPWEELVGIWDADNECWIEAQREDETADTKIALFEDWDSAAVRCNDIVHERLWEANTFVADMTGDVHYLKKPSQNFLEAVAKHFAVYKLHTSTGSHYVIGLHDGSYEEAIPTVMGLYAEASRTPVELSDGEKYLITTDYRDPLVKLAEDGGAVLA